MRCPYCRHPDSRVVDSREQDEGQIIRRRRSCAECGRRFTTVEEAMLAVIKRSGVTEPFSRAKVVSGVRRACQGRPVDEDALALLAQTVEEAIRATGAAEVASDEVGLAILGPLKNLDEVAYLRFASVYQAFSSIDDFDKADLRPAFRTPSAPAVRLPGQHRTTTAHQSAAPPETTFEPDPSPPARKEAPMSEALDNSRSTDNAPAPEDAAPAAQATPPAPVYPANGLAVERVFTTAGVHPYDEVTWERRDVVMTNWRDGSINFEQRGVEFPDFWSVNAANIVTTKYFRGAVGTDVREWSLRQAADRPRRADLPGRRRAARLLRARPTTPRSSSTS